MCELNFRDVNNCYVKDYEYINEFHGKTYNLGKFLKETYPSNDLYFIVGSDCIFEMHRWFKYKPLIENFNFIVAMRDGIDYINLPSWFRENNNNKIIRTNIEEGSSTEIRKLLVEQKFEDVEKLLDKNVLHYIYENGLYDR
jgi:nicotinate-nucleotide adenylyltransferase